MYDNEFLRNAIDQEGLGYAIEDYLDPDHIQDPEVREAWKAAAAAIGRVRELLCLTD